MKTKLEFRPAVCAYCQRQLRPPWSTSQLAATRDHVVPKHAGGKHMVLACRQCNLIKGGKSTDQWMAFMAANPAWWRLSKYEAVGILPKRTTRPTRYRWKRKMLPPQFNAPGQES